MNNKLTKEEIQQLFTFTQKHYVDWYDVQTELVDHLANGIEDEWENNPKLTFGEALKLEFKKFGICGFSDVIEEKTKALNKHYRLLVWRYFKDFFQPPKIIGTLFLIWSYYQVLITLSNKYWILIPTAILVFIIPVWAIYKQSRRIKAIKTQTHKKWLFDNISLQLGGMIHFIQIGLQLAFLSPDTNWSNTFSLLFSTSAILFSLALYVAIWVVTPKLRKTIALQHPEYKFA